MIGAPFNGTRDIGFEGLFERPVIFKPVAKNLTVGLSLTVKQHSSVVFKSYIPSTWKGNCECVLNKYHADF